MDPLYTPDDLAELLAVPRSTIGYWRRTGQGPNYLKFGNHFRYTKADIEAWLQQQAAKIWPRDLPAPRRYRRKEDEDQ